MSSMSDYLKDRILNAIANNKALEGYDDVYLALYKDQEELNGGNYKREKIVFSDPHSNKIVNEKLIEFEPASKDFGDVDEVAIYDSRKGGNLLFNKKLSSVVVFDEGISLRILEKELEVELD